MTTEAYRATFRERLSVGQIVYTPIPKYSSGDLRSFDLTKLQLSKGTVDAVANKRYPTVTYWNSPGEDPKGSGLSTAFSPRLVFTDTEVRNILGLDPSVSVDTLMSDKATSIHAAAQLLVEGLVRMGDDLVRNPADPEY